MRQYGIHDVDHIAAQGDPFSGKHPFHMREIFKVQFSDLFFCAFQSVRYPSIPRLKKCPKLQRVITMFSELQNQLFQPAILMDFGLLDRSESGSEQSSVITKFMTQSVKIVVRGCQKDHGRVVRAVF